MNHFIRILVFTSLFVFNISSIYASFTSTDNPTSIYDISGYYMVKVLEINEDEASVKLNVRMFNPDGGRIYKSVGFGLVLLDNGKMETSLISEQLNRDDMYSPRWASQYANDFVVIPFGQIS